jgi:hypothetical protein
MTCREFADFIADYASDELSDTIRAAFDSISAAVPTAANISRCI